MGFGFFVCRSLRHGTAKPLQDGGARAFGNNGFLWTGGLAVDVEQGVQLRQPGRFLPQLILIGEGPADFFLCGGLLLVEVIKLGFHAFQPLGHLR